MEVLIGSDIQIINNTMGTIKIISEDINWDNAAWILIIIIGLYLIKKFMKNRTAMRMGMTTKNMLLFANLKNYVNGMEETQRKIYENMLHGILKANDLKEEIIAIEGAADELHILDSMKDQEK